MSTIATLATEYGMEPYAVAAALDLGTGYSSHDELDEATEAEYREVLDLLADQADDQR